MHNDATQINQNKMLGVIIPAIGCRKCITVKNAYW